MFYPYRHTFSLHDALPISRSPLVDEIHRHAESLIYFGSTDKRSRAPHTTQISLVDEFLDRLPDSHAANAELFTEFLVRMEPFAVFLPTQNHRQDSTLDLLVKRKRRIAIQRNCRAMHNGLCEMFYIY